MGYRQPECSSWQIAIGAAARDRRKELGVSQKSLAALSGLKDSNLSAIEAGKYNLTLSTLLNLAHALDLDLDELLVRAKRVLESAQ